jgi:hypothetical protein
MSVETLIDPGEAVLSVRRLDPELPIKPCAYFMPSVICFAD